MTDTKLPTVEVLEPARPGRRRTFTAEQKQALLDQAAAPGSSLSAVARQYGVSPSLLFRWKRQQDEGASVGLAVGERVVGESEVRELQTRVRELERLLGKKTMENEILKEVVEVARGKGWKPRPPSRLPGGSR